MSSPMYAVLDTGSDCPSAVLAMMEYLWVPEVTLLSVYVDFSPGVSPSLMVCMRCASR